MSLLSLSRKLVFSVLIISIAVLLVASLSHSVESAGGQSKGRISLGQNQQQVKVRRFQNMDVRTSEPETMANVAAANASNITQRLQTRKTAVEQAIARLKNFSRGAQAKVSPLTGAVEVLRSVDSSRPTATSMVFRRKRSPA